MGPEFCAKVRNFCVLGRAASSIPLNPRARARVLHLASVRPSLVSRPLLSYIDVRHANFLPSRLTVGEVRDLGPCYTCLDELAPIRDESAERVSRHRRELVHQQVEQENPPPAEPEAFAWAKSKMVTRRVMSISRFVPDTQTSEQQQPHPAQAQTPPSPHPLSCTRKRPRKVEQT